MRLLVMLYSRWRMEIWYLATGRACFLSKIFLFTEHNQETPY